MKKALFLIGSPLQAICAMEAIRHYNIGESQFMLFYDESPRFKQLKKFFKERNINFEVIQFKHKKIRLYLSFLENLFHNPNGYFDYLFIGNYLDAYEKKIYLSKLKNGAKIVYLDDGVLTVSLLKETYPIATSKRTRFRKFITEFLIKHNNISDNNFFTMFDDIPNSKFNIEPNDMLVISNICNECDDTIYILGTNTRAYCKDVGLSEQNFFNFFEDILAKLEKRYKYKKIAYIPHPRENLSEHQLICEKHSIEYLHLNKSVELFFLEKKQYPLALYGFTSTALFTLKRMFPSLHVYNIFLDGNNKKNIESYIEINKYYAKHNIIGIFYKN